MGIAKSAPTSPIEITQAPQETPHNLISSSTIDTIPHDLFSFFGLDGFDCENGIKERLKEIYDWAKEDTKTLGDAMLKLQKLQTNIGQGGFDKMYNKIWSWVHIKNNIDDLRKRQEALEKTKCQVI